MLHWILEEGARRVPDKTALVCGGERFTYAEVDRAANRLARGLRALGVVHGARVAICLENTSDCVTSIFGVLKAGGVVMLVNPATRPEKLASLLDHAEAAALLVGDRKLESIAMVLGARPSLRAILTSGPDALPVVSGLGALLPVEALPLTRLLTEGSDAPPEVPSAATDEDLAFLLYTSGSTGVPKGVMLTHHNLVSVTRSITAYLELRDDDITLQVLPLSFGYGLTQLLSSFAVGGTLVLERSFAFPQVTLARIALERATRFAMVPTVGALLAQMDLGAHDLSSLRTITNAGAALAPDLARALREQLPHVRLIPMYGQTECIRVTWLPHTELSARPASVGRGMPGQELWIVDENGRRLPRGCTGELVVAGPHVMRGYWKMPEESAKKVHVGTRPRERVLFTGDLFHMDEDGWLTFISRRDDIIKTRGEKVSPREVEDALYALEGVAEAAVAGIPDAVLGQSVKAWVVPRPGMLLDERMVKRHCASLLEDFAVPRSVEIVPALPKTPNGKIDKAALKSLPGPPAQQPLQSQKPHSEERPTP